MALINLKQLLLIAEDLLVEKGSVEKLHLSLAVKKTVKFVES